jgi:hypothetical protein
MKAGGGRAASSRRTEAAEAAVEAGRQQAVLVASCPARRADARRADDARRIFRL